MIGDTKCKKTTNNKNHPKKPLLKGLLEKKPNKWIKRNVNILPFYIIIIPSLEPSEKLF